MMKIVFSGRTKRFLLVTLLSLILFVVTGAGVVMVGVYQKQWEGKWMRYVARILRLPAARVSGESVLYTDYLSQVDAAKIFLQTARQQGEPVPTELTSDMRKRILDQGIRGALMESLARRSKIELTSTDVSRAFDDLVARSGTSTTLEEAKNIIRLQFGWSEEEYKKFVIRPALLESFLKQQWTKDRKDVAGFQKMVNETLHGSEVVRYIW